MRALIALLLLAGCEQATPVADTPGAQLERAAIARGLARVEAGAQGGHKLARGYVPVATWSAHHIPDPGFRAAVADYLAAERRAVEHDIEALIEMAPFKRG